LDWTRTTTEIVAGGATLAMARPRPQPPARRRAHLRRTFDDRVKQEWGRYSGDAQRLLFRTLRQRFVGRHLRPSAGFLLELGPGPGRFTPFLRQRFRGRLIALDLSRESLRSGRRRARTQRGFARIDFIQGAGEYLPFRPRSIDTVVALGNIVSFAGRDGGVLLAELRRVVRPRGRLLLDFASPAASAQEFLGRAAQQRFLLRILRRPAYYLLDQVLGTGFQPYAPGRGGMWEFQFYTVAQATKALARAGFRVIDAMSVAPLAAYQDRVAAIAHRERKTWEGLLRLEERVGRRPGALESGHGFVVAAVRT